MVFVNTKAFVERVARTLERHGYRVGVLSGDVPQKKRESLLNRFQKGQLEILVATDVAARGLHIDGVKYVYNYDLPFDAEDYVHRIGRTARLGEEGDAISFACERYAMSLPDIEAYIEQKIPVEPVTTELLTRCRAHRAQQWKVKRSTTTLATAWARSSAKHASSVRPTKRVVAVAVAVPAAHRVAAVAAVVATAPVPMASRARRVASRAWKARPIRPQRPARRQWLSLLPQKLLPSRRPKASAHRASAVGVATAARSKVPSRWWHPRPCRPPPRRANPPRSWPSRYVPQPSRRAARRC